MATNACSRGVAGLASGNSASSAAKRASASANDGPDLRQAGPHDGCTSQSTHRHPYPAYDQFMTQDGSIVLRKNLRLERWDPASASWVASDGSSSLAQACSSK